jgi:hypothetical protein
MKQTIELPTAEAANNYSDILTTPRPCHVTFRSVSCNVPQSVAHCITKTTTIIRLHCKFNANVHADSQRKGSEVKLPDDIDSPTRSIGKRQQPEVP